MAGFDSQQWSVPENSEALWAFVQSLLAERDQQKQQAEEQRQRAEEQQRLAEERSRQTAQLQAEILRLQVELERYKKWYYGPRADQLHTAGELAQLLLQFAEELDQKPLPAADSEQPTELVERRVQRRKGRRDLARFENLPVITHVYELSAAERDRGGRKLASGIHSRPL